MNRLIIICLFNFINLFCLPSTKPGPKKPNKSLSKECLIPSLKLNSVKAVEDYNLIFFVNNPKQPGFKGEAFQGLLKLSNEDKKLLKDLLNKAKEVSGLKNKEKRRLDRIIKILEINQPESSDDENDDENCEQRLRPPSLKLIALIVGVVVVVKITRSFKKSATVEPEEPFVQNNEEPVQQNEQ